MSRPSDICAAEGGFSLVELLVALLVLAVCVGAGVAGLQEGLGNAEARGAAQAWQAAAAWAQVGVLWQGGSCRVAYRPGCASLIHSGALGGGSLDQVAPEAPLTTNIARWRTAGGATVTFGGVLASPDGGGSLYFHTNNGRYRVTVRPASGLTVRGALEGLR